VAPKVAMSRPWRSSRGVQQRAWGREGPAEEIRWTRAAAKAGWLRGVDKLGFLFAFTRGDLTLREGITDVIALHLERINVQSLPNFDGSLIERHGLNPVARAVMDALRLVPIGLEEERFGPLMREMPLRLRVEIERELITTGYLTGKPEGHLGPQARAALKAWVDAKGPLGPEPTAVAPLVEAPPAPLAAGDDGGNPNNVTVSLEDGERVARHVTGLIQNAKTVEEWRRAVRLVNLMAKIGDPTARWFLVDRFDDDAHVRDAVSTAEITRYSLDMMLTRPDYAKKVEFKFLFNIIGVMTKRRDHDAFASAFFDWLRDDPRLQANLASIFGQLDISPHACVVVTKEAMRRKVPGVGERNYCDAVAQQALAVWARESARPAPSCACGVRRARRSSSSHGRSKPRVRRRAADAHLSIAYRGRPGADSLDDPTA
jgi:hypothetical protein